MNKLILLAFLLLVGCTVSQKIVYKTDDLSAPQAAQTIPAMVEIRIFTDNRAGIKENSVLFNNPKKTFFNGKEMCINSEKHYRKDSTAVQFTRIMVEHFNKAKLFGLTFFNQNRYSNYYMTGVLNSFYAEQEFSNAALVGAQFGLIGAIATAGVKSQGKIIIDISELRLYRKDGTLVKDFGNFYKEFEDKLEADAYCWCAYWNANAMLKEFNTQLIEKIRSDMAGIVLEN